MTLDMIRSKLDTDSPNKYQNISSFIVDVKLMINNVYLYYRVIIIYIYINLWIQLSHQISWNKY